MRLSERIARGISPEELAYADACERLAMAHLHVDFHYGQLEGCDAEEFVQVNQWYVEACDERDAALDELWDARGPANI